MMKSTSARRKRRWGRLRVPEHVRGRGERCHWEIVGDGEKIGDQVDEELAEWAVPVEREHVEIVRRAALYARRRADRGAV